SKYKNKYILNKNLNGKLHLIVEDYMKYCLTELNNNSKTINNKVSAISTFFIWCVKRSYLKFNPLNDKLDRMKKGDYDKVRESYFLNDEQIEYIEKEMKKRSEFMLRDFLIWRLLIDTAGRRSAILSLRVDNFDPEQGLFVGVKEKGHKTVDFIITDDTIDLVKEYIAIYELKQGDYIFFSRNNKNKQMSSGILSDTVRRIGRLVGIDKLYPHSIRKTRINQLCNNFGIDIASTYANHNDITTTKNHYVKAKSAQDLRSIIIK
ncbi:MAG: tyrosine-type recombinase/integrase, partial [Paraclostridium sp.]